MLIRDHKDLADTKAQCIHCGETAELYIVDYAHEDLTWCHNCAVQVACYLLEDLCALIAKDEAQLKSILPVPRPRSCIGAISWMAPALSQLLELLEKNPDLVVYLTKQENQK